MRIDVVAAPIKNKSYQLAYQSYVDRTQHYAKVNTLHHRGKAPYVIAICPEGASVDSVDFSEMLAGLGVHGLSHIEYSLLPVEHPDQRLALATEKLSDELLAVLLAEQLYRAFRIMHHHTYHK